MHLARALVYFLVLVFGSLCIYYDRHLPAALALHFDAHGNPNGWMSKQFFFVFELILLSFVLVTSLFMAEIIEKSRKKWVNLPNKEYWMANVRRTGRIEVIGEYQEWFSVGVMVLFIGVNRLVFQANIVKQSLAPKLCGPF